MSDVGKMIPFGKKWRRIIESTLANYNTNRCGYGTNAIPLPYFELFGLYIML
jgi:hypothetical protein